MQSAEFGGLGLCKTQFGATADSCLLGAKVAKLKRANTNLTESALETKATKATEVTKDHSIWSASMPDNNPCTA